MTFKAKRNKIIFQAILLAIALGAASWFVVHKQWWFAIFLIPIAIFIITNIINIAVKSEKTILEFGEAVKYNDYSITYNAKTATKDMQPLFNGLNSITGNIKDLIREKNAEKIYLQKILEMVNIGIISFKIESGEITWINESFKNLTAIPYAKNINAFEKRNPALMNIILSIKPGQPEVFNLKTGAGFDRILINATIFKTDQVENKLIAIQNVNQTLDATESTAWHKLLNVMTHEIMNSVAPISSLADTLIRQVNTEQENIKDYNEDLLEGLDTIKKRSDALQRFAITYRNLSKITKPNLKEIYVRDIFENLQTLMQPTLDQKDIQLDVILKDPNLKAFADTSLIEQVLINLITNAIEAVKEKENPVISLSAAKENNKTQIIVADNGKGISDAIADQVFIPFFSARKNGNGIGLSLCKQIMALHKGSIQMRSAEGVGTVFVIQF